MTTQSKATSHPSRPRRAAKSFVQPSLLDPGEHRNLLPSWSDYASSMRKYDEAMVRGWKEEIDTLLVFAGLFSAVVTAFNIEAYHLLQDDSSGATLLVLQQIAQQLATPPATGSNTTASEPASPPSSTAFRPSGQSIRINTLWFSSLVFSLFSALIGIMVKQWTREYMAVVSLSSRDSIRLRQHRFDCMVAWRVPEIMALLPLLLQVSLILFFIGLIDFLFLLQTTVACVVTALVAVALLFYAATTLTPVFNFRCPYKSPQSWIVVRLRRKVTAWVHWAGARVLANADVRIQPSRTPAFSNWSECDYAEMNGHQSHLDLQALLWIQSSCTDDEKLDTLVSFLPELTPDNAAVLAYTDLARNAHRPTTVFLGLVRARSCSDFLWDAGAHLSKRARARSVHMLIGLLKCIPRDHDPARLGVLDVIWTLWELCVGACNADEQDPAVYQAVLNSVAELLDEDEPFRLRRAALSLLWESTYQWTYLYCPSGESPCQTYMRANLFSVLTCMRKAMGNIISFARASYQHQLPDQFLKACAIALLLAPTLDWLDVDTAPLRREQLSVLLRDLQRFLQRANEDGTALERRCVGRIAHGLAMLVEKGVRVVDPELPAALLEAVELGRVELSLEEHLALRDLRRACAESDMGFPPAGDARSGT
ncbi:hypothetical protein C8Q77DRAFT_578350 [Trametes polyzona]|nr:hypothetical protein C8Q77DRAFT_578350 [Trametes polyzona]